MRIEKLTEQKVLRRQGLNIIPAIIITVILKWKSCQPVAWRLRVQPCHRDTEGKTVKHEAVGLSCNPGCIAVGAANEWESWFIVQTEGAALAAGGIHLGHLEATVP